jgi:hypothetical protein
VKAEWSKMPLSCGGGYGVPLDHEVYIDERLKDNPQRAMLVCLHEVAELHRPIKNHCDIDILCIDQIDCLQQLDLLKT